MDRFLEYLLEHMDEISGEACSLHVVLRTGCNVVMVAGFAMGFKCTAIFFIGVIPLNLLVHSLHSNFHTRFFYFTLRSCAVKFCNNP